MTSKSNRRETIEELPGGEIISEGLRDLENNLATTHAYLTLIAWPQLCRLQITSGTPLCTFAHNNPEHRLYELLEDENPLTAHSRYNAYIRRLVSLRRALENLPYQGLKTIRC